MSDRSTSTRSSVLSRQLAVAHARIAELEASLAALAVDEPSNGRKRRKTLKVDVMHKQLVQAATSGFRFAVFHGYPDIPSAERAYSYALAQGYTTTTAQERGLALPLARIPASILGANNSIDEARLLGRSEDEPWYIVYQGVNPGVYPTYLEAALNTNGVRLAAHDSRETLAQAVSAFQEARLRGEVHIRRETKSR
ncbi:hypothetical protein C8F01DRAFT_1093494 [Mycena amicta]|nr:hypothetical protein C8F01DRAFT_1093494 [Mycena amicta]